MRAEPGRPLFEFPALCQAVRTWLDDAACLDPSLVALADLVARPALTEAELVRFLADGADAHAALGASALLELAAWSRTCAPRQRM